MSDNERGCYCGLWEKDPAYLESQGIPRGYCGKCQSCGKPGHTMHFPGMVPYTGSWCDSHYRLLAVVHPLGWYGKWFYGSLFVLGYVAWWNLR